MTIERVQMPLSNEELRHMGFTIGIADSTDGYHEDAVCRFPSLNSSTAKILATQSEAHAWQFHPRFGGTRRAPTEEMEDGSILDQLLVGGTSNMVVLDYPNYKTKAAQAAKADARANGLIPVLQRELEHIEERDGHIRARLELAGVDLSKGRNQVPVYWVEYADDWTPVQCRGLLDQLDGLLIRDLKKTQSLADRDIARTIERYGYDIQAAAYISGVERVMPDAIGRVDFEWAFVEPNAPFCARKVKQAGSMLELGRARWRYAINKWARCINSGVWPGYEEQEALRVEASPWALEQFAHIQEGEAA